MNSIRQSMRPRHQVLTLKCYPRHQRGAVEVKPNSSELSYLLYYASTRRSKLRKVGAFLEKKTESDVWRNKSGNVIVTLEILHALIDKCPRDLPLFSTSILHVLETILNGTDANLVEESVSVWDTFCTHYDTAQLSADVDHNAQYTNLVNLYASYASRTPSTKQKRPVSIPVAVRHRTAGLRAIKSLVASPSFAAGDGHLCSTVVPVILANLYSDRPDYLLLLQERESQKQRQEKEYAQKRRHSTVLPRNTISLENDPSAAAGTTEDVDQRAEEEVGVLALQSLKQVFSGDARGQIRIATLCAIAFAKNHDKTFTPGNVNGGEWSCQLFELMCSWTAVQDRFIILVSAVEVLVKSPIVEEDLGNQLALARIVRGLLHSSINFIGLSVMDVLVGLIQHILLLLQLGGEGSQLRPHSQQPTEPLAAAASEPKASLVMQVVKSPSETRKRLLDELQQCIGELATHVYYTDQIEDMVSAILCRLKPSAVPGMENSATAIQNPVAAADAIADSVSLQEKPHTDGFFSFDTARILALGAVRDIITVANSWRKDGHDAGGRTSVDIVVWEGTQWLLRDPDIRVRGAYVEVLLCWLDLELDKEDLRASTGRRRSDPSKSKIRVDGLSRRAVSNASRRSPARNTQSSFLQLLHLAVYDSAVEFAESEPDILMLHLLLFHLMRKLGVNSVRNGLPMIYALQEEMKTTHASKAKIALGSLVHGYFWALSDLFNFDTSPLGRTIFEEINRRTEGGTWFSEIYVPPLAFDKIPLPAQSSTKAPAAEPKFDLRPLDYRKEIVSSIEEGYTGAVFSPPTSPPASPSRPPIMPSISVASMSKGPSEKLLPVSFKEEMLAPWSREECIAAAARESARTQSLSGSKSGSGQQVQSNGGVPVGLTVSRSEVAVSRAASVSPGQFGRRQLSPGSTTSLQNYRSALNKTYSNSSGSHSVVRVSHLKQVLAGNDVRSASICGGGSSFRGPGLDDEDDTSTMLSADFTNDSFIDNSQRQLESSSGVRQSADSTAVIDHAQLPDDSIPPVPLLPGPGSSSTGPQLSAPAMGLDLTTGINQQLAQEQNFPTAAAAGLLPEGAGKHFGTSTHANGGNSLRYTSGTGSRADLDKLLSGLSLSTASHSEQGRKNVTSGGRGVRPPY